MQKLLLLLTIVVGVFSKIHAQTAPTIGNLANNKINVQTGSNYLLISNVTDGNTNIQNVTVTAISSNPSVLQVNSVNYTTGNKFAVVNVTEQNIIGVVTVTVQAIDVDGTTTKDFLVNVGDFYQKGVKYKVYDIVFWQKVVPVNQTPALDRVFPDVNVPDNNAMYDSLGLTVGPALGSAFTKHDAFTNQFSGYFNPQVSGTYTFKITKSQDVSAFYFSTVSGGNIYTSTKRIWCNDGTAANNTPTTSCGTATFTIDLEAGKYYPFYTVNWIVFSKWMELSYTGPGVNTFTRVGTPLTYPIYDITKPTAPVLSLQNKGVTFVNLKWKSSTDNDKVKGYNIYKDGVKVTSTSDSSYTLSALTANTDYSVVVTAYDLAGNESVVSNSLNIKTYSTDTQNPTPPTSISTTQISDMSATISWSGASDVGSEIIGYNVYVNGTKYNTSYITTTTSLIKVLNPLSDYRIEIESVDGGFNTSVKSSQFNFSTTKFNPLTTSPGIKKARIDIATNAIARNEGFGINGSFLDATYYSGEEKTALLLLKPSIQRWGALTANPLNFSAYSGSGKPVTIAKFIDQCNNMGSYAAITVGVKDGTDWRSNINTFKTFMEYLNGPSITPGGSIRASEGSTYTNPLLTNSKGIIIELGNEVWGAASHNAEIGASYVNYGAWCRSVAGVIKSSPYYDSTKVFICYSGRSPSPSDNYGLHDQLLQSNPNGSIDWIAISGYMGGNLNYDPAIPRGNSELDYYKNTLDRFSKNITGLRADQVTLYNKTKKVFKTYFYESNMTTPDYNGRLGQAILMSDYFMAAQITGGALPTMFVLRGGEWGIMESASTAKYPWFEIAKMINTKAVGNILNTSIVSAEILKTSSNVNIPKFDPIGAYLVHNKGVYSLMFFSRDYANDYQMQINLPDGVTYGNTFAKKYVITGTDYNTKTSLIDSSTVAVNDSMIVTVPKHSMVMFRFNGPDLNQPDLSLGYNKNLRINKVNIKKLDGTDVGSEFEMDGNESFAAFTATGTSALATVINPGVRFLPIIKEDTSLAVTITFTEGAKSTLSGQYLLESSNTCEGNGELRLIAVAIDDTTVFDEVKIIIKNQLTYGLDSCGTVTTVPGPVDQTSKEIDAAGLSVYPNPTNGLLSIESKTEPITTIKILSSIGEVLVKSEANSRKVNLNLQNISAGVYIIEISTKSGTVRKKILKN